MYFQRAYSSMAQALFSVPLGISEAIWNFCTLTRTPSAISSVTKVSPTSMTLPSRPPVVTTSSPAASFEHQRLMLLGLLLLRADQQEIEDDDEDHHHQQRRHAAGAAGRACLRQGIGNQSIHALTLVGVPHPACGPGERKGGIMPQHPPQARRAQRRIRASAQAVRRLPAAIAARIERIRSR